MASKGICDRVAIVGMGCTPFGEHWDKGADDLLVDAGTEAFQSAQVDADTVDAYWLGTAGSGSSGIMLSEALKLPYKPVSRLENMCATGSEAMRNAAYAVASGAYDLVMAIGVEKLKDSGFSGLTGSRAPGPTGPSRAWTAPATFSLLAPAYAKKYGVDEEDAARGADANRLEEPQERRKEPEGAVPEGGFQGEDRGIAEGCWHARHLRLLGGERRLCRRHLVSGRRRASLHGPPDLHQGAVVRGGDPPRGTSARDYDFTTFPEVVAERRGRLQAGPRHEPARRDQHGRGA